MSWKLIKIDGEDTSICLTCLTKWTFAEIKDHLAAHPRERPYPGRCQLCREPNGPLRPLENSP